MKKRTTLNIKEGLVEKAKQKGLNISKIAEGALQKAVESEPLYPTSSFDQIPISSPQRRYIRPYELATKTDEEWNEMLEEELEEYRRVLEQHREAQKERQRRFRLETAFRIENRYERHPFFHAPDECQQSIEQIKIRISTETNPKRLDENISFLTESREIWEKIRDEIESGELLKKWMKDTEISRRTLSRPHPSEEEMAERFVEDKIMLDVALPHLEEIIDVYQTRLNEINEARPKAEHLVKEANRIRNNAVKPVEGEGKLIDAMCEADSVGRQEELDKLLKRFRPLTAKINKMEKEHNNKVGEINALRTHTPDLLSFPSRKLLRLQQHPRIQKQLVGD